MKLGIPFVEHLIQSQSICYGIAEFLVHVSGKVRYKNWIYVLGLERMLESVFGIC